MAFRSHVTRPINLSLWSNRLIVGLTALAALAAATVMVTSAITDVWVAPLHVFLTWALVREVDPDHEWTALLAALFAGIWVLAGQEVVSGMALLALMIAARLVLNSTGRRPLVTDLIGVAALASAAAYTSAGWVAGFGIALAIYIDDRIAGDHRTASIVAAAAAALGASAVVTLTSALPETIPEVRPLLNVLVGVIALAGIIREPVDPVSITDSRARRLLERRRLHASRTLLGVLLFLSALLMGPAAIGLIPALAGYALALLSGEWDRRRRHG
jgi:hypothetical protein